MRETRISQWIAVALILAAVALVTVKWLVADITPGRSTPPMWHVSVRLGFRSTKTQSAVRLFLPRGGHGHTIAHEEFADDNLLRQVSASATSRNRSVTWRGMKADQSHVLGYSAWVHSGSGANSELPPDAERLHKLRHTTKMIQSDDPVIRAQAASVVGERQGAKRLTSVVTFVHDTVKSVAGGSAVSAVRCLKSKEGTPRSMSRLVCALLRAQRVPCQLVAGVLLEDDVRTHAFYWAEAWDGAQWVSLCPTNGYVGELPEMYFPLFRGDYSLARFRDCDDTDVLVTVERRVPPRHVQSQLARHSPSLFDRFSLASLPSDTQQIVGLLLLLPVGALMVACFRNLVGLSTFGIFMPILLSLAFRETQLGWGLFYLTMLVATGVVGRWGLDRLKLLMIPRLATVLTLIVSMMIGLIFFGSRFGIHSALSVGLFPMVIMTNAVERFFVSQSEDGTAHAIKESLTTVLVASCGFFLFHWSWLRSVLFIYPELLLVVVALLLLLGRYSGYRIMELWRFRSLAQEPA